MPWNPDRYHQFKAERAAPFEDLFGLITVREGMKVVDLGCGTGELTVKLAGRLPGSEVVGMDSSAEMLSRAQEHARPGLRFELASLESVTREWDLVFSHAAIQWVDDHRSLVPRLLSLVNPGGQLVVQVPSNFAHPAHQLLLEVASEELFASALQGRSPAPRVLGIDDYAQLLHDHGGENLSVFEKVYPHILQDSDAIADWMSGTALVPYFERLPNGLHEPFLQRYRQRLKEAYPDSLVFLASGGHSLSPVERVFSLFRLVPCRERHQEDENMYVSFAPVARDNDVARVLCPRSRRLGTRSFSAMHSIPGRLY